MEKKKKWLISPLLTIIMRYINYWLIDNDSKLIKIEFMLKNNKEKALKAQDVVEFF